MISLVYFHKSATELALLGVNTGEFSLSWSKKRATCSGSIILSVIGIYIYIVIYLKVGNE